MISHLRGTVEKGNPGEAAIDVGGVGYRVTMPLDAWDALQEGAMAKLWISTYVREDRLELYGFADRLGRTLFESLLKLDGVGPRLGIEICAVPRSILLQAMHTDDPRLLQSIKGIGKKTAEKLIIELKSLLERHPDLFQDHTGSAPQYSEYDQDAVAALTQLGYDTGTVLRVLKELPPDLVSTEERVATALRSL